LVASIAELEVWGCGCELIDQLINHAAKSSVFVSLEVGLEIIFCEAFVNL
jgi:hypothetical protein